MKNNIKLINPQIAFIKCFNTDEEREQYMYMYSVKDTHYFKNVNTREYIAIKNDL